MDKGPFPEKKDHVSWLPSCALLSFGFLDPWSWDW